MTSPPGSHIPHPSPSTLMPSSPLNPQPSPMPVHSPGPNLYMQSQNQSSHPPDSSPFAAMSPAAANWPGSPMRPSPGNNAPLLFIISVFFIYLLCICLSIRDAFFLSILHFIFSKCTTFIKSDSGSILGWCCSNIANSRSIRYIMSAISHHVPTSAKRNIRSRTKSSRTIFGLCFNEKKFTAINSIGRIGNFSSVKHIRNELHIIKINYFLL